MRELTGHSKAVHEEAMRAAKIILSGEHTTLRALIAVELDRTYEIFELTHLSTYCTKIMGLSDSVTATMVRIVRKSHYVPELATAVLNSEISLSNAKVIASAITPETKDEWIRKAKTLTKTKLEREVVNVTGETTRVELHLPLDVRERFNRAREIASNKVPV